MSEMTKKGKRAECNRVEIIRASLDGIRAGNAEFPFPDRILDDCAESQDASCAIMNVRGDVIAQHVVLPLHIGSFPACCQAVIRAYDDIGFGDAFLINHPYEGGSPHAPDMWHHNAGVRRWFAGRVLRIDRAQGRYRGAGARLMFGSGAGSVQ